MTGTIGFLSASRMMNTFLRGAAKQNGIFRGAATQSGILRGAVTQSGILHKRIASPQYNIVAPTAVNIRQYTTPSSTESLHPEDAPKQQDQTVNRPHRFLPYEPHTNAVPFRMCTPHNDDKMLEVTWRNDETQRYAYPWLRDNCMCASCYSSTVRSRIVSFSRMDVEAVPQHAAVSEDGETLAIGWQDGHLSEFSSQWMREYRFDASSNDPVTYPKMCYWGNDIADSLSIFQLQDILESDEALYEMLMELKTSGLCCIKGGGTEEGQVKKIADRIAFLHITYFGPTSHVKALYNAPNVAYTSKSFPMHTDLAYMGRPPGAQMIHCINQARDEGGENWFADGFKVALDLKEADPEAYEILCNVPMEFKDRGSYFYGTFYQRASHPVISLDGKGHPNHIYLSDHGRDPMLRVAPEQVLAVYRALKKFSNMYHHPKNVYNYKLQEGDIMTFDNRRVIHGRAAFKVTSISSRHLETGYLEWDDMDSRIRVLRECLAAQHRKKTDNGETA